MSSINKLAMRYYDQFQATQKQADKIEDIPMGDDDIRVYFPKAKIYRYGDIRRFNSIDEMLPKDKDYCFILYEHSPRSGHWVALMKNKKKMTFEYFEPYATDGGRIDAPLKWTPKERRIALGSNEPWLTYLAHKCPYEVIINPYDFQLKDNNIATCGRWCCFRLSTFFNNKLTINEFAELLRGIKRGSGWTFDQIVSALITKT
jgi:hypothetical protein